MTRFVAVFVALLVGSVLAGVPPAGSQAPPGPAGTLGNPGFESVDGDRAAEWGFQDAPGVRTISDDQVARSGSMALRADLMDDQSSRIQTTVSVEPNTDYVVSVWVRAENATARNWAVLTRDAADKTKRGDERISLPVDGQPTFVRLQNLTLDWTRVEVAFNSESSTEVLLMLAVWGGESGSVWWDDVSVVAAGDSDPEPTSPTDDHQWLHMNANLLVDDVDDLLTRVDRAQAAGANGVLFGDSKASNFGRFDYGRWEENMTRLADEVRARGMEFVMVMTPIGFCQPMLADNVDLAAGYPIDGQPMVVRGDRLVPVQDATVVNGGFEQSSQNVPTGWDFQDAPGERTFIDQSVSRSGSASLRADARGGQMSRLFGEFDIEPNRQYTLSAWIKTENLSARNVTLLVTEAAAADENGQRRALTTQNLSLPGDDDRREFFSNTNKLTTDGWTEIRFAFNSLDVDRARIGLAVFGGTEGSIWWDDIRIEATPTLNWLNRDGLPQSIETADGRSLEIGTDTSVIDDPKLGEIRYSGTYDSYHRAPTIRVNSSAGLSEGDRVELNGFHTVVTTNNQIGCSWNDPAIFELFEEAYRDIHELVGADGYLINYSEVRTGGAEPFDTENFASTGEAFASSAAQVIDRVDAVTGDADLYFWSDMIDPFHNARDNYYQVSGDLTGAAAGVDPERVTVLTWASGDRIRTIVPGTEGTADPKTEAELGVEFFAASGYEQIIGGFYDEDVASNRAAWVEVIDGQPNIVGSLYATWVRPRNFTQIEAFGDAWWDQP